MPSADWLLDVREPYCQSIPIRGQGQWWLVEKHAPIMKLGMAKNQHCLLCSGSGQPLLGWVHTLETKK